MKGSSSLTSCHLLILSRPLPSLIWAQLTLLVPALGIRSPLPQNGAPIHRVRAHSLTGIQNSTLKGKCLATGTKSIMGDIEDLVKVRNTLDMCFDVSELYIAETLEPVLNSRSTGCSNMPSF